MTSREGDSQRGKGRKRMNKSVTPDKGIKSTKGEEKACKREEEGPKKVFIVHW